MGFYVCLHNASLIGLPKPFFVKRGHGRTTKGQRTAEVRASDSEQFFGEIVCSLIVDTHHITALMTFCRIFWHFLTILVKSHENFIDSEQEVSRFIQ